VKGLGEEAVRFALQLTQTHLATAVRGLSNNLRSVNCGLLQQPSLKLELSG
jgi:hypothetical protein